MMSLDININARRRLKSYSPIIRRISQCHANSLDQSQMEVEKRENNNRMGNVSLGKNRHQIQHSPQHSILKSPIIFRTPFLHAKTARKCLKS